MDFQLAELRLLLRLDHYTASSLAKKRKSYYKKVFEEKVYEKPKKHIERLEKIESEIVKDIADLKKLV